MGVCPGSGSSVIRNCKEPPDLVFTGEMSHHEVLAVTERGGCVVSLFHSNSERGYLWGQGGMKDNLEGLLKEVWEKRRKEGLKELEGGKKGVKEEGEEKAWREVLEDESCEVVVSERDRDPYGIVVLEESEVQGVTLRGEGEVADEDDDS